MPALLLYALLTAALYYLGARALITRWLWRMYPPKLDAFMDCAACSGFWYGLILAATLGRFTGLDVLSLDSQSWLTPFVVALASIVTTPILAALMQHALVVLGVTVPAADPLPLEEEIDEIDASNFRG